MINNIHKLFAAVCIFCQLFFSSCGDVFTPDKEVHNIESSNKEWLFDSDSDDVFTLSDSLGNNDLFTLTSEWSAYNWSKSTSGVLGLREREIDEFEVIHQLFASKMGFDLDVSIEAQEPPQGTTLRIRLNDMICSYDLLYKKVFSVSAFSEFIHLWFHDGMYDLSQFDGSEDVKSRMTFLDTMHVGGETYFQVLRFELQDFKDLWEDSTVVNFAYAKNAGLLSYTTNDGHEWYRGGSD